MVNNDGTKKYAYVTLLMLGDLYTAAALVLAQTLKKANTRADIVILVTNDISEDAKKALMKYYDHIIEVEYIQVRNWRTKRQPHRKYLDYVFTKFHCFNLTQYDKIALIDADAIVLKYPDHIFTLEPPAGTYLEDKNYFISYDKQGNYVLPSTGKIEWFDRFCECCGHGKIIPKKYTDSILTDRKKSGVAGGLMLLKPKKGELESIIQDVTKGKSWNLVNKYFIWPEQQYLTMRYSGKWTSINPRFFGLQGYPHWKVLYGLQYGGDKPFTLQSKMSLKDRVQYPDYILWHKYFYEILEENKELINYKALSEPIQMNDYFRKGVKIMSRQLSRTEDKKYKSDFIKKIFGIKNVNKHHIHYYHLDRSREFLPKNNKGSSQLFENIKSYDYFEPLLQLQLYFKKGKSKYYDNLISRCKKCKEYNVEHREKLLNKYNLSDNDADEIILQYVKCRKKSFIITLWPLAQPYLKDLINFLKEHGNVYYYKTVELKYNGIKNLMFDMYDEFTKDARYDFITKKLDYAGISKTNINKVGVVVFDNIQDKKLSGQGSIFKKTIRNFLKDYVEKYTENVNNLRGNDLVHINDFFYQTVEYSQLFFNQNSLEFINKRRTERFLHSFFNRSFLKFNTFKRLIYDYFDPKEIMRICFMGGGVQYSYGIRPMNDIDCVIINTYSENSRDGEVDNFIYNNFVNIATKMEFADLNIEDSSSWRPTWTIKNNKILKEINVKTFSDIVLDPVNHYYYKGFKLYKLDFEIVRKFLRGGPGDYGDIAVLYLKYKDIVENKIMIDKNMKVILPPIALNNKFDEKTAKYAHKIIQIKFLREDTKNISSNIIAQLFI
jgi:glycogenin glucosyltransferase